MMLPGFPEMAEDCLVVTTGFLKGIRQNGQAAKRALLVDSLGNAPDGS